VNPAEWTAKELFRELASARLRHRPGTARASERDLFFISVPNPASPGVRLAETGALDHDYKYGRSPGQLGVEDTHNIPLTLDHLSPTSRNLILTKLPQVAERLKAKE